MEHITYRVVEHDGGWTYKQGETFAETFKTHAAAITAASQACREQGVSGEVAYIEYQAKDGKWITTRADGHDRPDTEVEG